MQLVPGSDRVDTSYFFYKAIGTSISHSPELKIVNLETAPKTIQEQKSKQAMRRCS